MSGSFHCPKCQVSYPYDKRRVGKAVVCTCGHRFLVPPFDYAAPPSSSPSSTPSDAHVTPQPRRARATPPAERTQSPRPVARPAQPTSRPVSPRTRPSASSDSSSEVLPLAEPVEAAAPATAARWADPVDIPEAVPIMEAEVVYPAASNAEPEDLTGNLFGQSGPYANPVGPYQPPPLAATLPPATALRPAKKRKKKGGGGSARSFSEWVAYAVLFVLLPAAALFTLIGLILPAPRPSDFSRRPNRTAPRLRSRQTVAPLFNSLTEAAPSGYPITLWSATKHFSGEFSVEYRQDGGPLDRSRQYYWVVTDANGRIEFPIPSEVWKQRDRLSGKPAEAASGQFTGPYTTFIEEHVGTSRNRISNDVRVTPGP